MQIKTKHLVVAGLGITALVFLRKAIRTGANLVVQNAMRLQDLDFRKLVLALDPVVKNPSNGGVRFKFPFIQVFMGDILLASSDVVNLDVELPPFEQVKLRDHLKKKTGLDFNIEIPLVQIASLTPQLVQLWTGAIEQLELKVEVQTTAFAKGLPVGGIPVNVTEVTPLRKPKFKRV